MKRPIKFRGYDTQDGVREMVTFTLDELLSGTDDYELVDPDSIAQLVGYDKDGNELYEGDTFVVPCGTEIAARFIANITPNAKLKEVAK